MVEVRSSGETLWKGMYVSQERDRDVPKRGRASGKARYGEKQAVVCILQELFEFTNSGIADENIQPPECLDDLLDHLDTSLWIRDTPIYSDDTLLFHGGICCCPCDFRSFGEKGLKMWFIIRSAEMVDSH